MVVSSVGVGALNAALADLRWPGPYIVKYALGSDPEIATPLWRPHGPPLPGEYSNAGPPAI